MTFSNVLAFILGGLVSAFVFYPSQATIKHLCRDYMNKKLKQPYTDYMKAALAYQFFSGIHFCQQKKGELPIITDLAELTELAMFTKDNHTDAAKACIESMFKL